VVRAVVQVLVVKGVTGVEKFHKRVVIVRMEVLQVGYFCIEFHLE
jgi:hypothetical protein